MERCNFYAAKGKKKITQLLRFMLTNFLTITVPSHTLQAVWGRLFVVWWPSGDQKQLPHMCNDDAERFSVEHGRLGSRHALLWCP